MSVSFPAVATDLRVERRKGPCHIGTATPAFSWRLAPGGVQAAYQLRLLDGQAGEGAVIWSGDPVASSEMIDVRYDGPPLRSLRLYGWQVRLWTGPDAGQWSEVATFRTAVLEPEMWVADWVSGQVNDRAALYLRGVVDLPDHIVRATVCATALGWYRFFVNGCDKTGNAQVPRWTHFDHMLEYQIYDVTNDVRPGTNVLAMAIADGRFRGHSGIADKRAVFGDRLAGFVQLFVEFADGRVETYGTNPQWRGGEGRILQSDPKRGEHADLRIGDGDWRCDQTHPARFRPVIPATAPTTCLVAEDVARVDAFRRLAATKVWRAPSGKWLVDFGQNFAGVASMRVSQPAGTCLTLTFSEVVGRDGELDTQYLFGDMSRHPPQQDTVISAGVAEWWQPWFTIHGFRYVEIDGLVTAPDVSDFAGIVLSSQLDYAGTFECSDARLNRLVDNVRWSMISNFVDTPTDCPTRERSGWTGDIQVFAQTACYLADVQPYLRRYLRNLALEQHESGAIPPYLPGDTTRHSGPAPFTMRQTADSAGWGDVAVMVPAVLHQHFGDRVILERQYGSMKRWVDHLAALARRSPGRGRLWPRRLGGLERYIVDSGFHWGEWLRPGESMPLTYLKHALRAPASVATAYLANSARLLAETAQSLGHAADAGHYRDLADKAKQAWQRAFVRKGGAKIGHDRQDDYVRALAFDLLPHEQRPAALARLVALIAAADHHLGTGFLSTPLLLPVLARFGREDIAYRLLLQDTSPSWLDQVARGATTTWESWEGYNKKGDARYSHNHYAFGAVVAWLFGGVAGIAPIEPGFRHIRFAPVIGGDLTYARARIDTPYGEARSAWTVIGDRVELDIVVPPGATGEVHIGEDTIHHVAAGRSAFCWSLAEQARQSVPTILTAARQA